MIKLSEEKEKLKDSNINRTCNELLENIVILKAINEEVKSRSINIAITKLEEARLWLTNTWTEDYEED